jgi:hypothetical protein
METEGLSTSSIAAHATRHRDVTMVFELLRIQECVLGFARVKSGLEIVRVQMCLCVGLYGLLLVGRLSSYREIARGAHEFIPWTVKTFDRRGW